VENLIVHSAADSCIYKIRLW